MTTEEYLRAIGLKAITSETLSVGWEPWLDEKSALMINCENGITPSGGATIITDAYFFMDQTRELHETILFAHIICTIYLMML
jgi:hypothetical protein